MDGGRRDGPGRRGGLDDVVGRHREAAPPLPRRAPRHLGRPPRPRAGRRGARSTTSAPSSPPRFFHDAVYDPRRRRTTRSRAPRWPSGCCRAGLAGGPRRRRSARWCGRPRHHEAPSDPTAPSCSTPTSPCWAATRRPTRPTSPACAAEYGHVDDDGVAHRAGRGAAGLAGPAPLYATATGRRRWEARARANMAAELATCAAARPERSPTQVARSARPSTVGRRRAADRTLASRPGRGVDFSSACSASSADDRRREDAAERGRATRRPARVADGTTCCGGRDGARRIAARLRSTCGGRGRFGPPRASGSWL